MKFTFFSFSFLVRFSLFFGTLLILSEGRLNTPLLLMCALGLTLIYQAVSLRKGHRLHLGNTLRFVPFFLYHSFLGALGVAKLIFKRDIALSPRYHTLTLRGNPSTNAITGNVFSLMPGTLSVALRPHALTLHILDESLFDEALIQQTHQKLESLFILSSGSA